ncbi:MAG: sterol desaturase family protein [Deltaproteobacteria bacterium]|nr:sterol desaturase family protein [Deltaproteobacteria bacterium]
MFDSDLVEYFSKIPPWQPPAIFVPLIAWTSWLGLVERGLSVPLFLAAYLGGVLIWTILEYWAHRKVFHFEATSAIGKRFIWLLHGVHHDWPHDKYRLVFPPMISVPLAAGFFLCFTFALGESLRFPAFAGMATGYLAYDMIHYFVHHFTPKSRIGKFLRRYHLAHHFKDPNTGFGVSNPLWDYVFGTAPATKDARS